MAACQSQNSETQFFFEIAGFPVTLLSSGYLYDIGAGSSTMGEQPWWFISGYGIAGGRSRSRPMRPARNQLPGPGSSGRDIGAGFLFEGVRR